MGKGRKGKPSMSEIQTLSGNLSGKRSASLLFTFMPYSIMKRLLVCPSRQAS